jgi:polysaccharide export outer membrane protein
MRLRFISCFVLTFSTVTCAVALQAQSTGAALQNGSGMSGGGNTSSAARPTAGSGLTAVPEDFSKLKIAPGFLLDVGVYDEPDLSVQLRVGDDGNVIMPLVGSIHVAGDTQAEAQQKIQESLKSAKILTNPQVTLNVVQYASTLVTVLGEVGSPGRLQLLTPHSLLDVISFAGGETAIAGGVIQVRHEEAGKVTTTSYHYGRSSNGDTISGITIHDGDTVIVPRAGIVYVLGAVNRAGGFLMQEDGKLDVAQALSLAMGTSLLAKTGEIHIIRRRPDGTFVEFMANYKDITNGKATPPQLQAQDIVYVPNSKIKTIFSDSQSIINSAATATIYRTVN